MIYPKCRYKKSQKPAIRYDGYVIPCCHYAGNGGLNELRKVMGDDIEQTHITVSSLEEINTGTAWKKLMESWQTNPPCTCIKMCSDKHDSPDLTVANSPMKRINLNNI
jgi:hypothetical protein